MPFSRRTIPAALLASLVVVALSCGGDGERFRGYGGLEGAVRVDGSSTVYLITEAMAEEFQADHPRVRVTVGISGSGGGFERFCNDETDISDASRPITELELATCRANGVEPIEIMVGFDGRAGVAGDRYALGYFGYAYYVENAERLKLVAIDDGDGCMFPTPETIQSREYSSLARPLFIYINNESLRRPEVKAFAQFYSWRSGQ